MAVSLIKDMANGASMFVTVGVMAKMEKLDLNVFLSIWEIDRRLLIQ
jgi:hypothetical protein